MDKSMAESGMTSIPVIRCGTQSSEGSDDLVTVEAPLQIVLRYGPTEQRKVTQLAMTMRTPGNDALLAIGYLYTENIIHQREDILQTRHLSDHEILVELRDGIGIDLDLQMRNSYVNSSCGICGKSNLEEIKSIVPFLLGKGKPAFSKVDIMHWPTLLTGSQTIFQYTGGIHAAALTSGRKVIAIQEDIGRHNAVDKLIGYALRHYTLPLTDVAMLVSARASFEMVQKALMAGIPIIAAMGATTTLAIELAQENDMTLISFLKENRFNIYSHPERVSDI
ncbi:MAG: formate dehydrogenase accessory sulfurtransferase FdhD [Saprospiraceae bacterium]|nr:formate dehydrogenase accessory sulfurtransferase FdhD [Saprospiraceae bacterium]